MEVKGTRPCGSPFGERLEAATFSPGAAGSQPPSCPSTISLADCSARIPVKGKERGWWRRDEKAQGAGGPPQSEGSFGGLWYRGVKGRLGVCRERPVPWLGRRAVEQGRVNGRPQGLLREGKRGG